MGQNPLESEGGVCSGFLPLMRGRGEYQLAASQFGYGASKRRARFADCSMHRYFVYFH